MVARTLILASDQQAFESTGGVTPLQQPANNVWFGDWADSVTFQVSIREAVNTPVTWSLEAKFQTLIPSGEGWQFQTPTWVDLQAEQVQSCITEGVGWGRGSHVPPTDGGWGKIADQSDYGPGNTLDRITVQRTIRDFGKDVRVLFRLTHVGASTGLKMQVMAYTK